jgi:transcriptional regulator of acetoin/glycerol metabolism
MAVLHPPLSTVLQTWELFLETGRLDEGALRPEIAHAWLRCRKAGVDPFAGRSQVIMSKPELDRLLAKRKSLIDVARPFMEKLYQFMASSSFVVVLCDERGYLLETVGEPGIIKNSPDINFRQGALWTEQEIGNNGVGTALFLQRPFQVSGGEHYCQKEHPWTCSGAPIFSESGQMIGVLEMSGPVEATHQHTLGMVVAAAEAIQQQLCVHLRNRELVLLNRELVLLNSHLSSLFLSVSDGVVVIDAHGIIQQMNPVAERIFKTRASDLVGKPFAQFADKPDPIRGMVAAGRAFSDLEMNISSGSDLESCLASGKPIKDEQGSITRGVIFLNPIHRINTLINRFSGSHATFSFDDIIGSGPTLMKAIQLGIQAAGSESHVLLCGESGTGKEMLAQAIHNRSARRRGPFIAINCGAIPRELIGSELFGYVEGAFTGAHKRGRPGKFELAAGGTLFLDEIGDMPLDQQVSLLRVLQDKSITRLGGDKTLLIDVRIICATNKDLQLEISKSNFRQDLYYRLNVISITLPPLREHREDIPLVFKIFHEKFCQRLGVELAPVDPEVITRLQQYDWPGNMREFQNAVEKIINAPHQHGIDVNSLPEEIQASEERPPLRSSAPHHDSSPVREQLRHIKKTLAEQERKAITELIIQHKGNLSEAARALGISRNALYRRIAKFAELGG